MAAIKTSQRGAPLRFRHFRHPRSTLPKRSLGQRGTSGSTSSVFSVLSQHGLEQAQVRRFSPFGLLRRGAPTRAAHQGVGR